MPTRFIKESCRTSKNLHAVADFSERVFWRLLTTADDYGRCLACPAIVKSHCFPLQQGLSNSRIATALQDLAHHQLLVLYQVEDREYAEFVTFEKHQGKPRAKTSKYPPASGCMQMLASADNSASTPHTNTDLSSLTPSSDLKSSSHTDWLEALKSNAAYRHVNFAVELGKMDAWLALPKNQKRKKTRAFVLNWLNKIEAPMTLNGGKQRPPPPPPKNDPIGRGIWGRTYGDPRTHGYD